MILNRYLLLIYVLRMTWNPLVWSVCPYEVCTCSELSGRMVVCSGQDLERIPPLRTGNDVDAVDIFMLDTNRITQIPDNSLPPNLVTIILMRNPITDISPNAFLASADSLETLQFSKVSPTRLPDALLKVNNLTTLIITETHITDWNDDVLKHLGLTLRKLVLQAVGLVSWPPQFKLFQSLTVMSVSNDSLANIPDNAFSQVKDTLSSLSIENAELSEVPLALQQLAHIEGVSLLGNNIEHLRNIPRLRSLMLAQNKISNATSLVKALLPNADILEFLNLQSNQLTVIPDFSSMSKLHKVDLSKNWISDHETGSFPSSLSILSLGMNQLTSIPIAITSITNLTELDLSLNALTEIRPDSIPANLADLDLHDNAIKQISAADFPDCSSLLKLNLRGNPITTVSPIAFQHLQQIQVIDLGHTDLTAIPMALASLNNLRVVSLKDIPTLVCTCPVDSDLYQWYINYRMGSVDTTVSIYGTCNETSIELWRYLLDMECPEDPVTVRTAATTPSDATTPKGGNLAPPLVCHWDLCFLMFVVMSLSTLILARS